MAFKDGDFLKVEYSMWRAADNSLVYTTDKQLAEKNSIYDKDAKYRPQLVVLGKGSVVKGVDKALRDMELNKQVRLELEPKDAFGERNPDLVRVLPLADLKKRDINPYPGLRLDIDGVVATVKSITSGRVLVDANPELAGEKLIYEIKVVEKLEDDKSRLAALAESYSLMPDNIEANGGSASIIFGSNVKKGDTQYFVNKNLLVEDAFKYMDNIKSIKVIEEYARKSAEQR